MLSAILPMRSLALTVAAACAMLGCAHNKEAAEKKPAASQPPVIEKPAAEQPVSAKQTANQPTTEKNASSTPTGKFTVDPNAIAALEKMGGYLRSLKTFEVRAATRTDEVMEGGLKLQFSGSTTVKVSRPNRLMADISSDRKQRQLYYDGKTLTLYGPRVKYYATVAAPPTLYDTAEMLAQKYGVNMPLADLFTWGTEHAAVSDIKAAIYIGPATVEGVQTDQYAFRQEGTDWQIWIQRGPHPLPRKLVIVTTDQPAQPEYAAILHWNTAPKLASNFYAFNPPRGAMKISMQAVDGAAQAQGRK